MSVIQISDVSLTWDPGKWDFMALLYDWPVKVLLSATKVFWMQSLHVLCPSWKSWILRGPIQNNFNRILDDDQRSSGAKFDCIRSNGGCFTCHSFTWITSFAILRYCSHKNRTFQFSEHHVLEWSLLYYILFKILWRNAKMEELCQEHTQDRDSVDNRTLFFSQRSQFIKTLLLSLTAKIANFVGIISISCEVFCREHYLHFMICHEIFFFTFLGVFLCLL